jgi:Fe-S-cluster containining protein
MYYHQAGLRFKCTGCSKCCHGSPGDYVLATAQELDAMRRHLGLSRAWFRRRYIEPLTATQKGIRLNGDGSCPFLESDGQCRVYAMRPAQCRSYPFWPENVASRAAWHREAKRCEGIGQGAVVSRRHIQAMLALDQPLQFPDD